MNWIKKNWGWMTVIIIGLLPLIGVLKMINLDFSGSAENLVFDGLFYHAWPTSG